MDMISFWPDAQATVPDNVISQLFWKWNGNNSKLLVKKTEWLETSTIHNSSLGFSSGVSNMVNWQRTPIPLISLDPPSKF